MNSLKRISRASLCALVLGFCVAPSCKALPASETMVVLQTDLSLPKDVDKVTIEVLVRGDRRHFNSFEKLGNQDSLKIPASLGLTLDEGTDASTPVTFRVTAFQGPKARVLREVVTTIPKDRLVALKLPIQWLCWDQVTTDAEGNAQTACADANQTCVAGNCVDKTVDPATLEDFAADRVFGGGTGTNNDGTCFDTAPCFDKSKDSPVDLAACTITASDNVNVAIRVDSAGICGTTGCYVPLDARSELGWKATGRGTIQLPTAVCTRIKSGLAAGVSVVDASTECPLKTNGIPTCGPWSSAGKTPTPPDELGPVMFMDNQDKPLSIAVAAKTVYWTVTGQYTSPEGALKKKLVSGGDTSVVQAKLAFPRDIEVTTDATGKLADVIWASAGTTMTGQTVLEGAMVTDRSFAVPAKPDLTLSFAPPLGYPEGVAASGGDIFFTDLGASAVYRFNASGKTLLAGPSNGTAQKSPYRIAVHKNNAFWTNEGDFKGTNGSVMLCAIDDPLPMTIAQNQNIPRNLVLDDIDEATSEVKTVYWTNYGKSNSDADSAVSEKVMKASLAGSMVTAVEAIATGSQPSGIAIDDKFIYWTNQGDNTVMKINKLPGSPQMVIARNQNVPGDIAIDETHIYWINEGGAKPGSIMRLSKSAPELK